MKFSNQVDLVQLEQFGVNQKADILESQINCEITQSELHLVVLLLGYKFFSKLVLKDHDLNNKLKQSQHDMNTIYLGVKNHQNN
jgi:hypothetical protein